MRSYITHQMARSFGVLAYRKAKLGHMMLVTRHGQTHWLGYAIPLGFYLMPYAQQAA